MNYRLLSSFCIVASLHFTALSSASGVARLSYDMPVDSIGVEKKGNKLLVLYKVGPGETLSSISRKYNTSVEAIQAENTISSNGLKLNDIIKVPYTARPSFAGKKVHIVEASQTLYAIARMYDVTTEDIKKWNNLTANEISLGQQLVVGEDNTSSTQITSKNAPATTDAEPTSSIQAAKPVINGAGNKVHVVAASQSLFSIARMYAIPVESLKQWNNLSGNTLKVGQELLLEDPDQRAQAAIDEPDQTGQESLKSRQSEATVKEAVTAEPVQSRQAEVSVAAVAESRSANAAENRTVTRSDAPLENSVVTNTSGFVKKVESGLAELIDSGNSDMFLALHRTAPVGTIMQVRNQMNDLSVFVKVIGKLPDTGANDKVVVKISKKAYERLAALDKRFRVELSYMP